MEVPNLKKTYILDTSVYLTDAESIFQFEDNNIVIPIKVLEELDKHKNRQDGVGLQARKLIRTLDDLRNRGSLREGVVLNEYQGIVKVMAHSPDLLPKDLDLKHSDHLIMSTALAVQKETGEDVVVVTCDINMRVISDSLGLKVEEYTANRAIEKRDNLYKGYSEIIVDQDIVDGFYAGEDIFLNLENCMPNEFLILVCSSNEKKTALARYTNPHTPLKKIPADLKKGIWGICPRNKEQMFAMDLLLDPNIKIVSLVGTPGAGKTLIASAAGLEQVLTLGTGSYKKILISRPVHPVGKDIGYLPGTLEEKMLPWLKPIQDNLQYLLGSDEATLEMYMDKKTIEVEAISFIRGRSIPDSFIIIDECQNITPHEIKTILTRVGENSKIVLTGDIEQIDNIYINELTNGLTHAVERFKEYGIAGHITLKKGERSEVATLAAKYL
tara:strand:- start:6775 stop:8097 length:1323 start_codon:yes stop_codon:yes gene_type:complete